MTVSTQMNFENWMKAVDKAVDAKADLSVYDLPDCPFADWFADGLSPRAAAGKALKMARDED